MTVPLTKVCERHNGDMAVDYAESTWDICCETLSRTTAHHHIGTALFLLAALWKSLIFVSQSLVFDSRDNDTPFEASTRSMHDHLNDYLRPRRGVFKTSIA